MGRGDDTPHRARHFMNNVALILKTAFPGSAIKSVARGVPCSLRQSERMLTRGRIPGRLRERVLELVDQAVGERRAELDGVEYALRIMELEETKTPRSPRKTAADAAPSDVDSGQD